MGGIVALLWNFGPLVLELRRIQLVRSKGAWDAEPEARLLDRGGPRGGLAQADGDARDVGEDGVAGVAK
jgi:hypothetical protein